MRVSAATREFHFVVVSRSLRALKTESENRIEKNREHRCGAEKTERVTVVFAAPIKIGYSARTGKSLKCSSRFSCKAYRENTVRSENISPVLPDVTSENRASKTSGVTSCRGDLIFCSARRACCNAVHGVLSGLICG